MGDNTKDRMVEASELTFVSGSSNKFYRLFTWEDGTGGHAVVQYGRNGTSGTLKATTYPDRAAADAFASKQLTAKSAKGYKPAGGATFPVPEGSAEAVRDQLDGLFAQHRSCSSGMLDTAAADTAARQVEAAARVAELASTASAVSVSMTDIEQALAAAIGEPAVGDETDTAPVPHLAQTLPAEELAATLDDPRWVVQPKLDGERFMVLVRDGEVAVLNREGQPKVTNITAEVVAAFQVFSSGTWVFDGEIVGRTLHLFDMAQGAGYVAPRTPFQVRYTALRTIVETLGCPAVVTVPCSTTDAADKRKLLDQVAAEHGEGIILRRSDAAYGFGRRGSGLMKHKFVNEADCVVIATGNGAKASATLGVLVPVGKASTIGKGNLGVGDVVEVRFQYVLDPANPVMVQPRIVRRRSDKAAVDCHLDQFATAGTNRA